MSRRAIVLSLLSTALVHTGCLSPSRIVKRPDSAATDRAINTLWAQEIANVAQNGDWLLSRSYYLLGDVITTFTSGEAFSHAAVYDADRQMVIEAVSTGVREVSLEVFLSRNHYVAVVRPANMTAYQREFALGRARTQVGKHFDTFGMFGIDDPQTFYCSELATWAAQTEARAGKAPFVVTPADLIKYGNLVYWSGSRTNHQTMAQARASTSHVDISIAE